MKKISRIVLSQFCISTVISEQGDFNKTSKFGARPAGDLSLNILIIISGCDLHWGFYLVSVRNPYRIKSTQCASPLERSISGVYIERDKSV